MSGITPKNYDYNAGSNKNIFSKMLGKIGGKKDKYTVWEEQNQQSQKVSDQTGKMTEPTESSRQTKSLASSSIKKAFRGAKNKMGKLFSSKNPNASQDSKRASAFLGTEHLGNEEDTYDNFDLKEEEDDDKGFPEMKFDTAIFEEPKSTTEETNQPEQPIEPEAQEPEPQETKLAEPSVKSSEPQPAEKGINLSRDKASRRILAKDNFISGEVANPKGKLRDLDKLTREKIRAKMDKMKVGDDITLSRRAYGLKNSFKVIKTGADSYQIYTKIHNTASKIKTEQGVVEDPHFTPPTMKKILGKGATSKVVLRQDIKGKLVADRTMLDMDDQRSTEALEREQAMEKDLGSKRMGQSFSSPSKTTILQYYPGGTYKGFIQKQEQLESPKVQAQINMKILSDVGHAILEMREKGIHITDNKPENVVLRENPLKLGDAPKDASAVVIDHGENVKIDQNDAPMDYLDPRGSPFYMAPEMGALQEAPQLRKMRPEFGQSEGVKQLEKFEKEDPSHNRTNRFYEKTTDYTFAMNMFESITGHEPAFMKIARDKGMGDQQLTAQKVSIYHSQYKGDDAESSAAIKADLQDFLNPDKYKEYPLELRQTIVQMLDPDPTKRPSTKDAVALLDK